MKTLLCCYQRWGGYKIQIKIWILNVKEFLLPNPQVTFQLMDGLWFYKWDVFTECAIKYTKLCHSYLLCPGTVYTVVLYTYIYSKKLWNWPEAKSLQMGFIRQDNSVPGWTQFCPQTQPPWGSSFTNKSTKCQTPEEKDALTSTGNYVLRAVPASQQTCSLPTPLACLLAACFIFKEMENCQI